MLLSTGRDLLSGHGAVVVTRSHLNSQINQRYGFVATSLILMDKANLAVKESQLISGSDS